MTERLKQTIEAALLFFPRAAAAIVLIFAVWGAVAAAHFARSIVNSPNWEPCTTEELVHQTELNFHSDWSEMWGERLIGFESGGYHSNAGPGAMYLRFGVGDAVVNIERLRCR